MHRDPCYAAVTKFNSGELPDLTGKAETIECEESTGKHHQDLGRGQGFITKT